LKHVIVGFQNYPKPIDLHTVLRHGDA
jgi:hypothetical protein